jgi:hypothetical protein
VSLVSVAGVRCKSSDHGVRPAASDVLDDRVEGCFISEIAATDMMEKSDFSVSGLHAIYLPWGSGLSCAPFSDSTSQSDTRTPLRTV